MKVWNRVQFTWTFVSRLFGSVPADPEIIKAWIDARKPRVAPPGGKTLDAINEEVIASLAEPEDEPQYAMLTFQYAPLDEQRVIALRPDTIRAHYKDCAQVISAQLVGKIKGDRSFAVRIKNALYQEADQGWVVVRRPDGTPITKPDGEFDRPIHTFRGSALKRLQYIEPPCTVTFTLRVLCGASVKVEDLQALAEYGGVHGYGGERSRDGGKYLATLKEID